MSTAIDDILSRITMYKHVNPIGVIGENSFINKLSNIKKQSKYSKLNKLFNDGVSIVYDNSLTPDHAEVYFNESLFKQRCKKIN